MTFTLLLTAGLLTLVVSLIAFVQLLYVESARLRTRESAALDFFKQTLEEKLGMKSETGVLTFSMIKYSFMLLIAILMLDGFAEGRPISWIAFIEAAVAGWLSMLVATYLVPYVLYRRTSGEWLLPFVPLLLTLALAVRPIVFGLDLLESLVGGQDFPAQWDPKLGIHVT